MGSARVWFRRAGAFLAAIALVAQLSAAEPRRTFNVPAGPAETALKQFAEQSGNGVIFVTKTVQGIKTRVVQGEMTAAEAIDQMLVGTPLEVEQDEKTGAFAVKRMSDPNDSRAARSSDRPSDDETITTGEVRMARLEVLGTRIRQTEEFGPSPVSSYDIDYIRSSGALTLADFLNRLPQTYSGVSAGRGSTPNELNPEFGSRSETITPPFNIAMGVSAVPANATGQSGVGLRGLGAGSTLVLVDGRRVAQSSVGNAGTDSRQGFVDLNTIPLGMVERIEVVTDGTSALYGADAVGGVINIVLKKDWSGSEVTASFKGAFDGGGSEQSVSLVHGFSTGPLRGTVSLDYYNRDGLKADERPFSAQQDHTGIVEAIDLTTGNPIYGANFLLNWGVPATVQARSGNLAGILANGNPTRVALTPAGLIAPPTSTNGFVGVAPTGTATLAAASGARRGNTAEFLDLIPPSERRNGSVSLSYALPRELEAYARYSYSNVEGTYTGQPAIFSASATNGFGAFASIVPAAYNPFGQDVTVGMIAYDFGGVVQSTETKAQTLLAGLKGNVGDSWRWDLSASWQEQEFSRLTREFNGAAVTAALANPDASQRLNPFIDPRAPGAPDQSAIFEAMARYITFDGVSELTSVDLVADGNLLTLPAGPIKMATGVSYERAENAGVSVTPSVAVVPVIATVTTGGSRETSAIFAELSVPFFSRENAAPLLQRLDLQVAGRYESRSDAGDVTVPKVGMSWSPIKGVLLRASYSEGFRAPSLTEYQQIAGNTFTSNSVVDPRRGNTVTRGVVVTRGANPDLEPETSTTQFFGLVLEPPQIEGLSLQVNYYKTEQDNIIQILTEQQLVNNEAFFPDRVTRTTPSATDITNGWPGAVVGADRSLLNFGRVLSDTLDVSTEYRLPWQRFGRWRIGANASHVLKSVREVRPGEAAVEDLGDTLSPPEWRLSGTVFWSKGPYHASLFVNYLSSFDSNKAGNTRAPFGIPSQQLVDFRVGYDFKDGLFRGVLKGARLNLGIGNVFDEAPPFSDTVFGYNGALHGPLGRTYELSLNCPF